MLKYVVGFAVIAPPRDALQEHLAEWDRALTEDFRREAEAMREEYWGKLRTLGLWEELSPSERELTKTTIVTMTREQQLDALWRMESLQVLMWALDMIPELPPYDTLADHDLLSKIPSDDVQAFIESARLIPISRIEAERNLAELWHWRARTYLLIEDGVSFNPDARLRAAGINTLDDVVRFTARHYAQEGIIEVIDEDFAARGKAYRDLSEQEWQEVFSISAERHFALNWLCGYAPGNRWDETPTDT